MAAHRWLLLLGSNLEDDALVREALQHLADLGEVEQLTAIRRFQAYGSGLGPYFNALARWDTSKDRDDAMSCLKALEHQLGRERAAMCVDIDVDILACVDAGGAWRADPHALTKGEFTHAPVVALLREAGIDAQDII